MSADVLSTGLADWQVLLIVGVYLTVIGLWLWAEWRP